MHKEKYNAIINFKQIYIEIRSYKSNILEQILNWQFLTALLRYQTRSILYNRENVLQTEASNFQIGYQFTCELKSR